jgi:hypothetical protein
VTGEALASVAATVTLVVYEPGAKFPGVTVTDGVPGVGPDDGDTVAQ